MRFQITIIRMMAVFFLLASIEPLVCVGQIREVRRFLLNDVGAATIDRAGNGYVEINPFRCRQLGPALCEFFRQHEYAHLNLNHFDRQISTRRAEAEADCYAAKAVPQSIANAAINYFKSGFGGSRVHGSSQQRAARVANCSQPQKKSSIARRTIRRVVPTQRLSSGTTRTVSQRTVRPTITRTAAGTRALTTASRKSSSVQRQLSVRQTQPMRLFRFFRPRTTVSTRTIRPSSTVVYRSR